MRRLMARNWNALIDNEPVGSAAAYADVRQLEQILIGIGSSRGVELGCDLRMGSEEGRR